MFFLLKIYILEGILWSEEHTMGHNWCLSLMKKTTTEKHEGIPTHLKVDTVPMSDN